VLWEENIVRWLKSSPNEQGDVTLPFSYRKIKEEIHLEYNCTLYRQQAWTIHPLDAIFDLWNILYYYIIYNIYDLLWKIRFVSINNTMIYRIDIHKW
jgi:hypothetical protein